MQARDCAQIDAALAAVSRSLGDAVLGVYQYGSAVTSGLRPNSDLDVLVVINRPTTQGERQGLVAELLECSGPGGSRIAGRPLEITIVRQDAVSPWPAEPEREFQYGEWLRREFEAGAVPCPVVDHDLAPLLFTALHGSHALVGPPLDQLIAPISHDALVAAMKAGVPSLLQDLAEDTRNVLLTLARAWYTTCTGGVVSKDEAAAWALDRLPHGLSAALAHAKQAYLGEVPENFAPLGTAPEDVAALMVAALSDQSGG